MDNRAKDGHMLYGGGVSIPDAALGRDGTCAVQHSQAQLGGVELYNLHDMRDCSSMHCWGDA